MPLAGAVLLLPRLELTAGGVPDFGHGRGFFNLLVECFPVARYLTALETQQPPITLSLQK